MMVDNKWPGSRPGRGSWWGEAANVDIRSKGFASSNGYVLGSSHGEGFTVADNVLTSTSTNGEWQLMDGGIVDEILVVEVDVFLVEVVLYTGMKRV